MGCVGPGAENVRTEKVYDGAITYRVPEAYPGLNILTFLREELAKRGWEPIEDDFLNPEEKSSHVRGWSQAIIDRDMVYSWTGQWRSRDGDVVSYSLSYRYPVETEIRPAGPISVRATLLRKTTADAIKRDLRH